MINHTPRTLQACAKTLHVSRDNCWWLICEFAKVLRKCLLLCKLPLETYQVNAHARVSTYPQTFIRSIATGGGAYTQSNMVIYTAFAVGSSVFG